MLYCNTVGSQTEIVFDGGSLIYDINGSKIMEMKYFEEDYQVFDLENSPKNQGLRKSPRQEAI
jgi:NAD+ synthase (glutamine-hydrolysing)